MERAKQAKADRDTALKAAVCDDDAAAGSEDGVITIGNACVNASWAASLGRLCASCPRCAAEAASQIQTR